MYKINWKNEVGVDFEQDFETLDQALVKAKELGIFVTINGGEFEIVGCFGVDSVQDGLCPDGVAYDWNKASRIGAAKRRSV